MLTDLVARIIELTAKLLEVSGIAIIGLAFLYATIRSFLNLAQKKIGTFFNLKSFIGRSLQLGLEFMVAADIIRTVSINQTREGILTLGLLIIVRTFLSWSITIENEGCWPWQVAKLRKG